MPKTLVVYFSRTGYTRRVAQEIADHYGADIEAIREQKSRFGLFGYLRSAREGLKKTIIDVEPADKDPANYDLVILGTPVWAGHVCSPVRGYVAAHKRWLSRFAIFCTEGGSGGDRVAAEVANLIGRAPVATLVLHDREIDRGTYRDKLGPFMRAAPAALAA